MPRLRTAFSLVEVVMALGIFTFCIVALLGLLSNGFTTERRSGSELDAAALLKEYSIGLENSQEQTNGSYLALAPWSSFTWTPGATNTVQVTNGNYAIWLQIKPASTVGDSRLIDARFEIAWPSSSAQWGSNGNASKAAGTLSGRTFFFVR